MFSFSRRLFPFSSATSLFTHCNSFTLLHFLSRSFTMSSSSSNPHPPSVVYWFRKSLRLHDSPSLLHTISQYKSLVTSLSSSSSSPPPLMYFIFTLDPYFVHNAIVGTARFRFLFESLNDINLSLIRDFNQRLLVLKGNPIELFPQIIEKFNVKCVGTEFDHEPYALFRDGKVMEICKEKRVQFDIIEGISLFDMRKLKEKMTSTNSNISSYTLFQTLLSKMGPVPLPLPAPSSNSIPPFSSSFQSPHYHGKQWAGDDWGIPSVDDLPEKYHREKILPSVYPNSPADRNYMQSIQENDSANIYMGSGNGKVKKEGEEGKSQMKMESFFAGKGDKGKSNGKKEKEKEETKIKVKKEEEGQSNHPSSSSSSSLSSSSFSSSSSSISSSPPPPRSPFSLSHHYFIGGETESLRRLHQYMSDITATATFSKPETSPAALIPSTTTLSPYMKFGCLSTRTFWHAVQRARETYQREKKGKVPITSPPVSLHGQLLFREYFYLSSFITPNFDKMLGNPQCRQIDWSYADDPSSPSYHHFIAWKNGQTGYPWIDAIMRQLKQQGWIHHLARHAVACFLTRGDLFIHWEKGREVFDELLVDQDWALNAANWQWLSCSHFFHQYWKIYSPISFGKKYDTNGDFIRHFVPELRRFPAKYIYEPWKAPISEQKTAGCIVGKDYPTPIVEHDVVSKKCMERMKKIFENIREEKGTKMEKEKEEKGKGKGKEKGNGEVKMMDNDEQEEEDEVEEKENENDHSMSSSSKAKRSSPSSSSNDSSKRTKTKK